MKLKQDSNNERIERKKLEKRQRSVRRSLLRKFKNQKKSVPLMKRIVQTNWEKVDFFEEYDKMLAWCGENRITKITVLRYNNWIKNHMKWKIEREAKTNQRDQLETYERKKSKSILESKRGDIQQLNK